MLRSMRLLAEGAISIEEFNEGAKLEKWKLYGSEKAKALSAKLREIRKEKDPAKRKTLCKEARKLLNELKSAVNDIPDDDVGTWLFNLFFKPWWWFIADILGNMANGGKLSNMSRTQATAYFDAFDRQIKQYET